MKPIIFITAAMFLAGCTPSLETSNPVLGDKLAEIQARGTLVIATDADYKPLSWLVRDSKPIEGSKCEPTQYTADQFDGFDAAVAKELARRLGVEACFVTPPWSQLIAGNWGDHWDIHAGSVAITFERMEHLYFFHPYYATPTVLVVHQTNTSYHVPEDLSGKRIGICAGCTFESYLKGTLKMPCETIEYRIQNAQIIAYENEDPAIQALSLGDGVELDAVMTILPKARTALSAGAPIRILDAPLLFAYATLTLDRDSGRDQRALFVEINQILGGMHTSGRLHELSLDFLGVDLTQQAAVYDISALHQFP